MARMEYGFARTTCACRACSISCEHLPGALAPLDLPRIAAHLDYTDLRLFACENLLASDGAKVAIAGKLVSLPTLVPATRPDGSCNFLKNGRCAIHAVSPYGCAFIDVHIPHADYLRRADALYRDLHHDQQQSGPYSQTWNHLHTLSLDALPIEKRQYRLEKALKREKLL